MISLSLAIGKAYLTRSRKTVTITDPVTEASGWYVYNYHFFDSDGNPYTKDGRFLSTGDDHESDLIFEIEKLAGDSEVSSGDHLNIRMGLLPSVNTVVIDIPNDRPPFTLRLKTDGKLYAVQLTVDPATLIQA